MEEEKINSNTLWKICLLTASIVSGFIALISIVFIIYFPIISENAKKNVVYSILAPIFVGLICMIVTTIMQCILYSKFSGGKIDNNLEDLYIENSNKNTQISTFIYTSQDIVEYYQSYIKSTHNIISLHRAIQITSIISFICYLIAIILLFSFIDKDDFGSKVDEDKIKTFIALIITPAVLCLIVIFFNVLFFNRWCRRSYDINDLNAVYTGTQKFE